MFCFSLREYYIICVKWAILCNYGIKQPERTEERVKEINVYGRFRSNFPTVSLTEET